MHKTGKIAFGSCGRCVFAVGIGMLLLISVADAKANKLRDGRTIRPIVAQAFANGSIERGPDEKLVRVTVLKDQPIDGVISKDVTSKKPHRGQAVRDAITLVPTTNPKDYVRGELRVLYESIDGASNRFVREILVFPSRTTSRSPYMFRDFRWRAYATRRLESLGMASFSDLQKLACEGLSRSGKSVIYRHRPTGHRVYVNPTWDQTRLVPALGRARRGQPRLGAFRSTKAPIQTSLAQRKNNKRPW